MSSPSLVSISLPTYLTPATPTPTITRRSIWAIHAEQRRPRLLTPTHAATHGTRCAGSTYTPVDACGCTSISSLALISLPTHLAARACTSICMSPYPVSRLGGPLSVSAARHADWTMFARPAPKPIRLDMQQCTLGASAHLSRTLLTRTGTADRKSVV